MFSYTWNTQNSKILFQFWKQPSPSEKICLPVQVLLQSHNAVSKSWPCIHFCGPLYTPVLSINSAGKKSCRLHRDVDGGKGVVLLCCTRQNVLRCGAWWHTYSLHHFYLSYFLRVEKKYVHKCSPAFIPKFRLIVIITCNTIELKYIFMSWELLEFTCHLQH